MLSRTIGASSFFASATIQVTCNSQQLQHLGADD
jgi:hypothetical protein